jgi:hypothetical protein
LFIDSYVLLLEIQLPWNDCWNPVNRFNPATFCACPIPGPGFQPVSSTNKSDRHDITEKLLKVALNTITHIYIYYIKRTIFKNKYPNVNSFPVLMYFINECRIVCSLQYPTVPIIRTHNKVHVKIHFRIVFIKPNSIFY